MVPLETPELTTSLSTRREERGEEERGHRRKGNDSLSTGVPLPKNGTKPHNTWCGNVHATSVCVCVCVRVLSWVCISRRGWLPSNRGLREARTHGSTSQERAGNGTPSATDTQTGIG